MDEVRDRFGLREVDATIEEGASRELAGQGCSSSGSQHCIEHSFCREDSTVTGNLYHIFARKSARCLHYRQQHFVHYFPMPNDVPVMNRVGMGRGGCAGVAAVRDKD